MQKRQIKYIIPSLILAGLLISGCSQQAAQETVTDAAPAVTQAAIQDMPTYLVATEASYAPYEFRDEAGKVIGFDADLLEAIGEKQGFRVQILSRPWDGIFDTVETGERDIVAAALKITPERLARFEVSMPYAESTRVAVVRADSGIESFADLQGKSVATQTATTHADVIREFQGNVIEENTQYLAFRDVLSGKTDSAVGEGGVMRYYVNTLAADASPGKNDLRVIEHQQPQKEYMGFMIKKGRKDLANEVNAGLQAIQADGTYAKIHQKWFGSPASLPTATAAP
ncbi:MAG: transporter substrate-binding domain-containing protein [Neisseria sp.]|nr:transporter substrate-binding domain-containing protein [Neisseria sp.]